ncbi:acyl-CoA dehydrogenase [Tistrella bauzanensis]|uniref:Acyl-CoA dehydrogenase n=1 Tax=Tistrella bauzanensis TaxID=657419 RepID=A0ABQ1IFX0_9PROT|nr:acyl-CoA dehydrogenase family protein [Tistrella bauzanensis]GGB36276.1 acyl-CoA dehydrogenase [Tistrella bauzanensis]
MQEFTFAPAVMPPAAEALRTEVRDFLADARARGLFTPRRHSWSSFDPAFSAECGQRGFIGMTWPKEFGGGGRSALERYVMTEEMLAGGAPVGAHWVADRQSGHQILHHGSERAKALILPQICAGTCFFGIGMSEPDSGSDLAAARTRAVRVDGGWSITGRKVWTSNAHRAHYLIVLARTEQRSDANRHAGLSQFIVPLDAEGIEVRPIYNLYGGHDFNEVVFDGVFAPDDMMIGQEGSGWTMVTGELSFERSGPDRFLSTVQLLLEVIDASGPEPDRAAAIDIGRKVAELAALRRMSTSIAGMLDRDLRPITEAALVKDLGTAFEQSIPEVARRLLAIEPRINREDGDLAALLGHTVVAAPAFTIRGGTREILRGMIARGLGLR